MRFGLPSSLVLSVYELVVVAVVVVVVGSVGMVE